MALLKIIKAGDPVLKATAKPVAKVNKHIKKLLDDMAETMYAAEGVGLAAPQVNESLQLIVLDDGNGLIELINPEILEKSDETNVDTEGCLSIPGYYGKVERASKIKVRSLTRHARPSSMNRKLPGPYFQHEIDISMAIYSSKRRRIYRK